MKIEWNKHTLAEEKWDELDQLIFSKSILQSIQFTKAVFEVSLAEAMELAHERHLHLRVTSPQNFTCSLEQYYNDVYT